MNRLPEPSLRYIGRLTDGQGVIEHARFNRPRRDLGYCTDDAGRALAVASILAFDREARRAAEVALRFLFRAYAGEGQFQLRLGPDGRWTHDPPTDDAAGRALYGLGMAVAKAPWPDVRAGALARFDAAATFRSAHPRSMAYGALGAVALLDAFPDHAGARRLVADAAQVLPRPMSDPSWRWPAPRLTYANAVIPEASLAIASVLGDREAKREALALLGWLIEEESQESWFSFAPVAGRGPGDPKPAFDQQPIEAWAMADACARAYACTGDLRWLRGLKKSAGWFLGENDVGAVMFDPVDAGGFDGLQPNGVNRNMGAEASLAFVATMAQAHRFWNAQFDLRWASAASESSR